MRISHLPHTFLQLSFSGKKRGFHVNYANMDDAFKIFIEQLRGGQVEKIHESFKPTFLEVNEQEVSFVDPVLLHGQAYLADNELVLNFDIKTFVTLPCSVCNEPVKKEIAIQGFYHAVPLEEIRSGVYNFKEVLRETILLDIPLFAECNEGHCPHRKEISKFLKPEGQKGSDDVEEEGYNPFADFDWDKTKKSK